MTEEEKLKLINEDMYCNKYDMPCGDVPYEIIYWIGGLGFSNYECDLICSECNEMKI